VFGFDWLRGQGIAGIYRNRINRPVTTSLSMLLNKIFSMDLPGFEAIIQPVQLFPFSY
jgi:hypothetical protein